MVIEEMCLQKARLMGTHADHMREEFRGCIISLDMYRVHLNQQSKAVIRGLSNTLNLITLQISGTRARGFQWDY